MRSSASHLRIHSCSALYLKVSNLCALLSVNAGAEAAAGGEEGDVGDRLHERVREGSQTLGVHSGR